MNSSQKKNARIVCVGASANIPLWCAWTRKIVSRYHASTERSISLLNHHKRYPTEPAKEKTKGIGRILGKEDANNLQIYLNMYMWDFSNSYETLENEIFRNKWRRLCKGFTLNQRIKSQLEKRNGGVRLLEDSLC